MKKKLIIYLILLVGIHLNAKNPINALFNNPLLEHANISLAVKDLNTGELIYQHQPQNSMIPASTTKLVTTTTALELLGADFRFETKIEIDGEITNDSTLFGNIIIKGSGDPTLGSEQLGDSLFLQKWVNAVKIAGINEIRGGVVADASIYDNEGINPKWLWEDMGTYYGAGSYGISYMDNICKVILESGEAGTKPQILRIIPDIKLRFNNELKISATNTDSTYILGAPGSNFRTLRGCIPANRSEFVIKGDIPNPALLLAQDFNKLLKKNGISITLSPSDNLTERIEQKTIYTHYSPRLSDIITETNVNSNNQYAEQLFRRLALQTDSIASSKTAVQVVRSFWESKGLPVKQLFMNDGSGLSATNGISAQFLVDLLAYMKNDSVNSDIFFKSLPVAGETGTLKSVLKRTALQGKVSAKSGTMTRVRCYAGYLNTDSKNYAFAILANNAYGSAKDVTKKIEEFLLDIAK